ncbi:ArsR/SmtB family transcription factor [Actinacidiphila yeochonensis]|uniref:ArsR/SmtB family transcription factor n=1 Tax=Actinacidiphila yeochonensis TaxID=89050 RepID=UPI000B1EF166|nr:metalloregulator ArsR/SmtB family transcription factor [Actinacidiphila yeochonensis]
MGQVFKALADPTRRLLLDRLREHDGQTLGELCGRLGMARQSATQHLDLLVRANLVTVVRRGRERLHYLNPVPIHELQERWISGFDRPRLRTLGAVKNLAEEYAMGTDSVAVSAVSAVSAEPALSAEPAEPAVSAASTPTVPGYVYVTYIRASAEQVWRALTDADLTARYWGHANVSDWQPGSDWEHRRADGSGAVDVVGTVLAAEPPTRLVITFEDTPDTVPPRDPSVVTFLVEPHEEIVRLTVTHENLPNREMLGGISKGWPAVLANLKSLLETGEVLPQAPWEM